MFGKRASKPEEHGSLSAPSVVYRSLENDGPEGVGHYKRMGGGIPAIEWQVSDHSLWWRYGLTSNKLEGLRYELIAVLVVRHDCTRLS